MKKSLRLEMNMKLLRKLRELSKEQSFLRSSKKLSEILTISKKFYKLLTESSMFQYQSLLMRKDLLKFHTFWKRLSKRLLLCLKSLKFLDMFTKSLNKILLVLLLELMLQLTNKDTNYLPKILKFKSIFF